MQILLNVYDLWQPFTILTHTRQNNSNLFFITIKCSNKGAKRISIALALKINKVLRNSSNLNLKDFTQFIFSNSYSLSS